MSIIATVENVMSHIKDSDHKYVILTTACSEQKVYENFYSNFPQEMKEPDVTLIEFQSGCIILHIL